MKTLARGATVAAALAASLVIYESGSRDKRPLQVYKDLAGVPTVCDGITGPSVIPGKVYTHMECDRLLMSNIYQHEADISKCIDLKFLPEHISFAIQHFAFNVGAFAFCNSTMKRLIARGDFRAGCAELMRWTFIKIKGVKRDCKITTNFCGGLVVRRHYERGVCDGVIDWREQQWQVY